MYIYVVDMSRKVNKIKYVRMYLLPMTSLMFIMMFTYQTNEQSPRSWFCLRLIRREATETEELVPYKNKPQPRWEGSKFVWAMLTWR